MSGMFRVVHSSDPPSIVSRRSFEAARASVDAQQSLSLSLIEHAEWEKRSNGLVKRSRVLRKVAEKRAEDEAALGVRRAQLRRLLQAEEAALQLELSGLVEGADARKLRVMEEARRLRELREQRRDEAAQRGYDAQWKERCDDLRQIDSHFFALHCHDVVETQIKEQQQRNRQSRGEEKTQADRWEQLRKDKVREEDHKARARKEATKANHAAIKKEVERRSQLEQDNKQRELKEKEITVSSAHHTTHTHSQHLVSELLLLFCASPVLTRVLCCAVVRWLFMCVTATHPGHGRRRGTGEAAGRAGQEAPGARRQPRTTHQRTLTPISVLASPHCSALSRAPPRVWSASKRGVQRASARCSRGCVRCRS